MRYCSQKQKTPRINGASFVLNVFENCFDAEACECIEDSVDFFEGIFGQYVTQSVSVDVDVFLSYKVRD